MKLMVGPSTMKGEKRKKEKRKKKERNQGEVTIIPLELYLMEGFRVSENDFCTLLAIRLNRLKIREYVKGEKDCILQGERALAFLRSLRHALEKACRSHELVKA